MGTGTDHLQPVLGRHSQVDAKELSALSTDIIPVMTEPVGSSEPVKPAPATYWSAFCALFGLAPYLDAMS